MSDAKVVRVPNSAYTVQIPKATPIEGHYSLSGCDMTTAAVSNVSFSIDEHTLLNFGGAKRYPTEVDTRINEWDIRREYEKFYNELVEHCKHLYISEPWFSSGYDAMRHEDVVTWKVNAWSPQFDFFRDLFHEPEHIRTVEKKVYVVELPHTIRECLKQAWIIFRKRFSRER